MLARLKKIVKNNFSAFYFFYRYLRYRIFPGLLFSLMVGVLDGFGLAMFLPLLQMVDNAKSTGAGYDSEGMGNLSFLIDGMQYFGLSLTLTTVLVVMLVFFFLKGVARFVEGYYRVISQRYFVQKLRFANIDLLSRYGYKSFVLEDSGKIQNTFSGEVERVVTAYRSYFSGIQFGVLVLVYIVLAFLSNAQFAIMVAIGGGLTNFLYKRIYKTTKKVSRELTEENHVFQGLLIQKVTFFKYLKATGFLSFYGKKLKLKILEINEHTRTMGLLSSALAALREPVVVTVVICVILVQVNVMGQPLGLIILSLLFFYRSLSFLMAVQNFWNTYLVASGSLDNMEKFEKALKAGEDVQGSERFAGLKEEISVQGVDFFYQDTQILQNVSLSVRKNETVAFVGESGSGKTTLMNLLAGLMIPDRGDILIDGVSVRSLDRTTYQRRLGYITQDAAIFNDTVFNNVTLWASPTAGEYGPVFQCAETGSHI